MDIDSFIEHYRPEWERLETACRRQRNHGKRSGEEIDELVRLYLRASGHLAEARTCYHDPRLEAYLNRVVGVANAALYGGKVRSLRSTVALFGSNYRAAARRTLPFILIAAAIVVAVTVSVDLWVAASPHAQAGLLSASERAAIRTQTGPRPGLGPRDQLSTMIFFNNVQVAVLAFITGIGLGIGSIYLLIQNSVMLGALAGASQAAGKSGVFWPLILPHGLLELTAICIGAGAGLRMGWSIIAPGDRPRSVSLVEEGRDSVMVVLGVIPAFAMAALIEGFITPSHINHDFSMALGVAVAATYNFVLFGPVGGRARSSPDAGALPGAPLPAELLAAPTLALPNPGERSSKVPVRASREI